MAGAHVFGDDRLGIWIAPTANLADKLADRLPKLRTAVPALTDVFLPRAATSEDRQAVLAAGFLGAHMWWAVDGLDPLAYAKRTLADIERAKPGAGDLNIELGTDSALEPYMRVVIATIRAKRPSYRLRLNVAFRKGAFVPADLVQSDANLYVAEQNYVDPPGLSMAPTSAADALLDLLEHGFPMEKAAVCYGAAGSVGGKTGAERVNTLPNGGGWLPRRGVVFHDDLMADAGLI